MKSLKLLVIIILLVGTTSTITAQRNIKVYPKHGTVVTTLYQPRLVVHKRVNFHFSKGIWYKARGRKYVVCAAPVGIKVRKLPVGNKVVVYSGKEYYTYNGVFYKKKGRNYIVVNV
ncbi:DUF6515 family protein [uncultured Eudoraea sp.]|jgi:hypothetical protein|uniref:DUF6515 family protein n=1 Tax=uncultured Eudoraea sp. TaxID=1035614 RepID=UPI002633C912|nr:DUF6515 family protein [uncultured Eudoraea sp.]